MKIKDGRYRNLTKESWFNRFINIIMTIGVGSLTIVIGLTVFSQVGRTIDSVSFTNTTAQFNSANVISFIPLAIVITIIVFVLMILRPVYR